MPFEGVYGYVLRYELFGGGRSSVATGVGYAVPWFDTELTEGEGGGRFAGVEGLRALCKDNNFHYGRRLLLNAGPPQAFKTSQQDTFSF